MRKGWYNGVIQDNDIDGIVTEDRLITEIGSGETIKETFGWDEECFDLEGKFLSAGRISLKEEIAKAGMKQRHVWLGDAKNNEEILSLLQKRKEELAEDSWLFAFGCPVYEGGLSEKKLDEISATVPVILTTEDRSYFVNTTALKKTGLSTKKAIDLLKHNEQERFHEAIRNIIVNELKEDILAGCRLLVPSGITTACSVDFPLVADYHFMLDALERVSYEMRLPIRIVELPWFDHAEAFATFLDEGYTMLVGEGHLMIGPLYLDPQLLPSTEDEMELMISLSSRFNMSTWIHTPGTVFLKEVLELYGEYVLEDNPLHHGLYITCTPDPEDLAAIKEKKYDRLSLKVSAFDEKGNQENTQRASLLFMDGEIGTLKEGYNADFVIHDTEVKEVYTDGEKVYPL